MMKWAQINIQRGLQVKVFEVVEVCDEENIDLVAFSETGLCPEFCSSPHVCAEVPHLPGWKWVGESRNIHGGGVGFLVRDTIPFDVRYDLQEPGLEQIWIEVYRKNLPSVLVCSVYIPPRQSATLTAFAEGVFRVLCKNNLVLILGDLNSRSTMFGDSTDNDLSETLLAFVSTCDLNVHNEFGIATRFCGDSKSILDMTLSSQQLAPRVSQWCTSHSLPSDHCLITFEIAMSTTKRPPATPRYAWDFRKCDWARFSASLDSELETWLELNPPEKATTVDILYQSWLDIVLQVAHRCIPRRKLTHRSRAIWSPKIEELVRRRRKYLRAKCRCPTLFAQYRYQRAHRAARAAIRAAKIRLTQETAKFLAKASKQEIFNRFRRASRSYEEQIPTIVVDGNVLRDRPSQTRAFNDYFSKAGEERPEDKFDNIFKDQVDREIRARDTDLDLDFQDGGSRPITEEEVRRAVTRMGSHKAPGPDGVHPLFIKKGGLFVVKSLTVIFNASFSQGRLPKLWKLAYITPIPKKIGSRIPLHRPISLMSIPGKLEDRIVAERVTFQAEQEAWFGPFQGGFRRGRSTTDQLLAFRERISQAHRRGCVCVTSFLDLSRAYDRTWRQGVVHKLIQLGLRGRLLVWIMDFLRDRRAAVSIAGVRSDTLEYRFGLPQGSCLSPVLFNVYLSDLFPKDFINSRRDVGVFADDIRLACYEPGVIRASGFLTRELDKVALYAKRWRLSFDVDSKKCGTMTFSFSKQADKEVVIFGDTFLTPLEEYKHLGVIFDRELTFKSHVERVRKKAWAAFHRIRNYTSSFWGISTEIMILLYKAFVQPVFDYACPVWCLASESALKTLEPVHYAALRVATGATSTTSREALENYCGLFSLKMRREFLCSVSLFRCMRLDPEEHPVAKSYHEWRDSPGQDRNSVFHYTRSLVQAQGRFQKIDDGGASYVENIRESKSAPWLLRPPVVILAQRKAAVAEITELFETKKSTEIFVFTDGSCVENPGRAGLGVLVCTPVCSYIISEQVGIASILTAELCAIHRALQFVQDSCPEFLMQRVTIHVCVDNIAALRISNGAWESEHNWQLTADIHEEAARIARDSTVQWHWSPAHEGLPGNEYADKLAKRAAFSVEQRSPQRHRNANGYYPQPPIPASVSRSLCKTAISTQQGERWLQTYADHLEDDHLSRIKLSTTFNPRFTAGNRRTQVLLAQLRFGHSDLRAHVARLRGGDPTCDCGLAPETTNHFLQECPKFVGERLQRDQTLERIIPPDIAITESVLLGAADSGVPTSTYRRVAEAVGIYIQMTRRL